MQHLLIDVGNTCAKYCLVIDGCYRAVTFQQAEQALDSIAAIVIATVANNSDVDKLLIKAVQRNTPIQYVEVMAQAFGISCGYPNYQNLGIDRWLAVVGAEILYPNENIVIVDAGTAMTVDFLTADKQHLGGWIIPGLELMQEAIVNKAPKVFKTEQTKLETFGTDTPSAVYNGCLFACESTIYSAVEQFSKKVAGNIRILITGGNAKLLSQRLKIETVESESLLFLGMNRFLSC